MRWRLLISALIVFGAAILGLSLTKGGYTSSATVWVEKPLYLPDQTDQLNRYLSAATIQANALNELLGTRRFVLGIAEGAGIPMNTTSEEGRVIDDIQKKLNVDAAGTHLIRLSYTGDKPTYTQVIISQTIASFVAEMDTSKTNQIDIAKKVLTDQLSDAAGAVTKSRDALNKYLQNNPGVGAAGASLDPTLTDLQKQYDDDRTRYSDLTAQIEQLNTSAQSNSSAFFRVIDSPTKAEPYKSTSKDLIRNALIAVVLSLLTMVGVTLVGTWTDSAIYTLNDVSSLALADSTGDSRDLLVGILPYVKTLGEMRKRDTKLIKDRAPKRGPTVTTAPPKEVSSPVPRLAPPAEGSAAFTSDTSR